MHFLLNGKQKKSVHIKRKLIELLMVYILSNNIKIIYFFIFCSFILNGTAWEKNKIISIERYLMIILLEEKVMYNVHMFYGHGTEGEKWSDISGYTNKSRSRGSTAMFDLSKSVSQLIYSDLWREDRFFPLKAP